MTDNHQNESVSTSERPPRALNRGGLLSSERQSSGGIIDLPEPLGAGFRQSSVSTGSHNSSARFESFTEAVPLSLSSMAHASLPLEDGVLDGLRQVLSHTLLSCVNYARIVHPPHQWSFRDLTTSAFSWTPIKSEPPANSAAAMAAAAASPAANNNSPLTITSPTPAPDLPLVLTKLKFMYQYSRNAYIYLRPALPQGLTLGEELKHVAPDWPSHVGILGRVSLWYTSTELLTAGELDGTDVEDMPPTILYKIIVEYRSLPATGNPQAVQAEELSMLSFGGSVDDDVKYGALAALYDQTAKYVLEIYSVRGKKYKFDLMDSTLSNGTIPRLPSSSEGDPFVKSLCVTVTDHRSSSRPDDKRYAITRIHLTLEGKPRVSMDDLPPFDFLSESIKTSFLLCHPDPPPMATAHPSGHTLILDPAYAGRVYVNGRYVTTWGQDPRIGAHGQALFGMDLLAIPFWHGRIVDYEALKHAYAQLWVEILTDAHWFDFHISKLLLYRLLTGHDADTKVGDDEYDDDDNSDSEYPNDMVYDTTTDCLESQVLSSLQYDRIGIAPKALATRFRMEFGVNAFPCLSHEVERVRQLLPDRRPMVVPSRLLGVLRRGGYADVQRTADDLWFIAANGGRSRSHEDNELVQTAVHYLEAADCEDVSPEQIVFVTFPSAPRDVIGKKYVCRYSEVAQQYCVHGNFLDAAVADYAGEQFASEHLQGEPVDWNRVKAYLLGLYIAQAHPDGRILAQYCLRNSPCR
jgi:hypothetical protein